MEQPRAYFPAKHSNLRLQGKVVHIILATIVSACSNLGFEEF